MRLAPFLAQRLGVAIADSGDSLAHLLDDQGNLAALERCERGDLAAALIAGARVPDIAFECVIALVSALQVQEDILSDHDRVGGILQWIGHELDTSQAAHWIEVLLARVGAPDDGELALFLYEQLVIYADELPDAARHAMCVSILPLIVALDGPHAATAANVLTIIATKYRDDAADLPLAVPRLCELVAERATHGAATQALVALRDPRGIQALLDVLDGDAVPPDVKAYGVASAMRELHVVEAVPRLLELLEEAPATAHGTYIYVLASLDRVAAAPVVARVADPDVMNATAVDIIGEGAVAGDAASRRFLERALRSPESDMRSRAARWLAKL